VAILAGKSGSTTLIVLSSAVLSFQLPFAIIPLVKFTSSSVKMGDFANSRAVTVLMVLLGLICCSANVYLIYGTFFGSDGIVNDFEDAPKVLLIILLIIIGICYFVLLGYLAYRPVRIAEDPLKYTLLTQNADSSETELEELN